jgi:hypothetical protein
MIALGSAELDLKKATGYEGEDPGRLHGAGQPPAPLHDVLRRLNNLAA